MAIVLVEGVAENHQVEGGVGPDRRRTDPFAPSAMTLREDAQEPGEGAPGERIGRAWSGAPCWGPTSSARPRAMIFSLCSEGMSDE